MHANIEGFGKIAGYIDKIRKTNDHVLYLDAGDISSGNPVVDLKNGKPIVTLLNEMKLDAMTIGNHEFDYGQGNFRDNQNLAKFPWLSANTVIKDQNVPIKKPQPYKIFTFKGVKVGVLALTQAPPATAPTGIKGLSFNDPFETVEQHRTLREKVDILIGLTHIGYDFLQFCHPPPKILEPIYQQRHQFLRASFLLQLWSKSDHIHNYW